jgi:hypothetical protein
MMKFLCLAYLDRGLSPGPDVATKYGELLQAMKFAGVIIDSGQLAAPADSKIVRCNDGETEVGDAALAGSISGRPSAYFLIDCADLDEAMQWAARIPAANYGSIEVRPPR